MLLIVFFLSSKNWGRWIEVDQYVSIFQLGLGGPTSIKLIFGELLGLVQATAISMKDKIILWHIIITFGIWPSHALPNNWKDSSKQMCTRLKLVHKRQPKMGQIHDRVFGEWFYLGREIFGDEIFPQHLGNSMMFHVPRKDYCYQCKIHVMSTCFETPGSACSIINLIVLIWVLLVRRIEQQVDNDDMLFLTVSHLASQDVF